MGADLSVAPGKPGRSPHWTWASKSGVGTAPSTDSSVWFTLSHGILTEIFYPVIDTPSTRSLELIVTDRKDFFSTESYDTTSEVQFLEPGVPAYRLVNTCKQGRYRLEKVVLADPRRAAVLMQVRFTPLQGKLEDYAVFVLLNPHAGGKGAGNTARVGEFKGTAMLFGQRHDVAMALACTAPWLRRSAGYVGASDGWEDLSRHKRMEWTYDLAEDGNVALTGEVDLSAGGEFVLALGFGHNQGEAGHRARSSLLQGFTAASKAYVQAWSRVHKGLLPLAGPDPKEQEQYRLSASVMRVHESKHFQGAIIASLAIPWGFARGDDYHGYHVVWPRDMIQTVGGLMAARQHEDARRVLFYFRVTQNADGHWPQNMWLDGTHNWNGIQLDETAFVILLTELAYREKALSAKQLAGLWPMVRRAAGYLVRHGPVTPMDRWEEESGYFASTLAVEIPALLVAADQAERAGERAMAAYLRETADAWNDAIEELIYVTDTELARAAGVEGYYVRFALPDQMKKDQPAAGTVKLKNHPDSAPPRPLADIVSPDALQLVRFGLRSADDPRIASTVRVIDHCLRTDTPRGPCWHRYSFDGYGEHEDGAPFDGTGIGRLWPLLTGERAHYELAAGRREEAERLLGVMEELAGDGGLIPEQVWDTADIPERELYLGRPTGSAMPLVWAHAEHVKLRRSLRDGKVFDTPHQPVHRYLEQRTTGRHALWRRDQPRRLLPAGKILRVEVEESAIVRWSLDGGRTNRETPTRDTGLGMHLADLPTAELTPGEEVVFSIHRREGADGDRQEFSVRVASGVHSPHPAEGVLS